MENSIFREKSIDRISSPEELDDYMKVTSPALWMIFATIILILIAVLVWSVTGRIEENLVVGNQIVTEEIAPIELLFR